MRWTWLSFVIGIAVGWILHEAAGEGDASSTVARVPQRLTDTTGQSLNTPEQSASPVPVVARATSDAENANASSTVDDLTIIKGIGDVFAARLAEIGITRFSALAQQDAEALAERLGSISAERIEREGWIDQAHDLANDNRDATDGDAV